VSPLSRTPNGAIRRTNTTPYGEARNVLAIGRLFGPALFELAIGRYASRAFDACVRAEKRRVTELREGARLGASEPAAALTGSRRPGQSGGRCGRPPGSGCAPHGCWATRGYG